MDWIYKNANFLLLQGVLALLLRERSLIGNSVSQEVRTLGRESTTFDTPVWHLRFNIDRNYALFPQFIFQLCNYPFGGNISLQQKQF